MQQCQAAVDQLALFSNNEDADDIATAGQEQSLCLCVCWPTCIQFFEVTNTELVTHRSQVHAYTRHAW